MDISKERYEWLQARIKRREAEKESVSSQLSATILPMLKHP
jgi:hypothetical protein